jgi:hypothetical protein
MVDTIGTRAVVMTHLLSLITYLVVLILLFFTGSIRERSFVFHGWVFLTSVYILFTNQRLEQ